jgi:hypothetical protein
MLHKHCLTRVGSRRWCAALISMMSHLARFSHAAPRHTSENESRNEECAQPTHLTGTCTQVCAQFRVKEVLSMRGPNGVKQSTLTHEPTWVFVKHVDARASRRRNPRKEPYGGWRLCARLRDLSALSGVGSEVSGQIPSPDMQAKLAEGWSVQKAAMKAEKYTLAGMMANLLL